MVLDESGSLTNDPLLGGGRHNMINLMLQVVWRVSPPQQSLDPNDFVLFIFVLVF